MESYYTDISRFLQGYTFLVSLDNFFIASIQATSRLNTSLETQLATPSKEDSDTLDLSTKCCTIARELQVEIEKLKINKSGHRQAISKTIRAMRKSSMLKEKQAKLEKYKQLLDNRLLIRLDTRSLRQSYDIDSLDQSVRDLASRLERGLTTTNQLLADYSRQIQDHFDRRFNERESEREVEEAREKFKASLFFPEIESRYDQIPEAFEGTCRWIFDPQTTEEGEEREWPNFRDWLVAEKGAYWITGKPGSGKSTLMKYIIDEPRTGEYLSEWEPDSELIVISFFFWNPGTELQKSATGLLRSLLYQTVTQLPDMLDSILKDYGRSRGQSDGQAHLGLLPTWTDRKLLSILQRFVNQKPNAVSLCAFIDGLDEFVGDEDLLLEIIRLLISAPGCKVCVSSRPEQAFRKEFGNCPRFRMQDLNDKDIRKMVFEKLKPSLENNMPTERRAISWLVEELIAKAEGVFLWLNLMIKDLVNGSNNDDSMNELRLRLQRAPRTINELYKYILQGLDPLYLDDAFRYFQVLIAASKFRQPVSLLGLACAEEKSWAHIKQFDRAYFGSPSFTTTCLRLCTRLISRSGGLIDIAEDKVEEATPIRHYRAVNFIHRTAVEFLQIEYKNSFNGYSWLATSGVQLARANIGWILLYPPFTVHMDSEVIAEKFIELIDETIAPIAFVECSAGPPDFSMPLSSEPTDLVSQLLQTLQHMATLDDDLGKDSPNESRSMKSILQRVEYVYKHVHEADNQDPFTDHMSWATFLGCRSYVHYHLSAHTFSDARLDDLFLNAVLGLYRRLGPFRKDFWPQLTSLLTMKLLLEVGLIPSGKTSSWRPFGRDGWRGSPWAVSFLVVLGASDYYTFMPHEQRIAWITTWSAITKKFLSLGADSNTRISFCVHIDPDNGEFDDGESDHGESDDGESDDGESNDKATPQAFPTSDAAPDHSP
ncbi:MAG: hypothetical protein Q9181_004345, partial [Wetmoreana brouardii]